MAQHGETRISALKAELKTDAKRMNMLDPNLATSRLFGLKMW